MRKKDITTRRQEQPPPTPEASQAHEGRGEIDPKAAREQVAILAYELWESNGRPEGTDLQDWFRAERHLRPARLRPLDFSVRVQGAGEHDGCITLAALVKSFPHEVHR